MNTHTYAAKIYVETGHEVKVYEKELRGRAPDSAVIVSIYDPARMTFRAAWLRIDALGDDRDLQARVIGRTLLESLDQDLAGKG